MDPSWSDIKRILHKHEDMAEGSRLNFSQLSRTIVNQKRINVSLLKKIKKLEQEKVQERQRNSDLEQIVRNLSQRVDVLELLSSILGITKEIMSRGPQVLDMEYREPYDLSLALEDPSLLQCLPSINSSNIHPIDLVLK
jgi:hypothetical protein